MASSKLGIVILAAGKGERMASEQPKVLHQVAGRAMLGHVLAAIEPLGARRVVVVVGPGMDQVAAAAQPHETAVQTERLGTGHAVLAAKDKLLAEPLDQILVLYGDTPMLTSEVLSRMTARKAEGAAIVALAFEAQDPAAYGRMVTDARGRLEKVVEAVDADAATLEIKLCNAGVLLADAGLLFELLDQVGKDNPKGEYFLTDVYGLARQANQEIAIVVASEEEVMGVNSRAELAVAERAWQDRLRRQAMARGATLIDPATVWLSADTALGRDVVIEPGVVFGPGVTVADGAHIKAFSHLEGATVGAGAMVGPFARLRPGAELQEKVRVGNFVEVKNATLEAGAKANHLAYLGDATVGAAANIGAGTIFCNYDGFAKHRTEIGAGAFIGSNSTLIAPVAVGAHAVVAGGSTIDRDVAADDLAFGRARQDNKAGRAAALRGKLAKTGQKGRT
ncbi:MAG: bifunctional UDP-N-acetylglucosamine diphosphorylase/glucosamine-1-phosphate N-acetyltransferase GlmU [Pseudomonadota bacterium]